MEGEGQRSMLGVDWTILQKQAYKYEGWVRRRERSEQKEKAIGKEQSYELGAICCPHSVSQAVRQTFLCVEQ